MCLGLSAQDGAKTGHDGAKMGQDGAKTPQTGARKCQDRDGRPGVRTNMSTPLGLRTQDGAGQISSLCIRLDIRRFNGPFGPGAADPEITISGKITIFGFFIKSRYF